jgi:DNA replication protein DnaC
MIQDAFSKTSFNVCLGSMGSGKTSLIVSLLRGVFKKCFNTIYVIMPPNSRASLENDIFSKLPQEQVYDDLNENVLK